MFLIGFEIASSEIKKELSTEHGWSKWNWSTEAQIIRDYFAKCADITRPNISPKCTFQILHTSVPLTGWLLEGKGSVWRVLEYQQTRSAFRKKVMEDWFENVAIRDDYVMSLLVTVSGDVAYDQVWDRLLAQSKHYRGDVSVVEFKRNALELSLLSFVDHKLHGMAVGEDGHRLKIDAISEDRADHMQMVEYFDRVIKEVRRREELAHAARMAAVAPEESDPRAYRMRITQASNKLTLARVIHEEVGISLTEALKQVEQLPYELEQVHEHREARMLSRLFESVGASVELIEL